MRTLSAALLGVVAVVGWQSAAHAGDCGTALTLLQQGNSVVDTARLTGMSSRDIEQCKRAARSSGSAPAVSRRFGPAGPPPVGAAGPPPMNPAGPPPLNPAGPPPGGSIQ